MSSLELITELRAGKPVASQALRERVRAIGAVAEPAGRRGAFPVRRAALVLVPASLVAVAGAAGLYGLVSGGSDSPRAVPTVVRAAVGAPPRGRGPIVVPTPSGAGGNFFEGQHRAAQAPGATSSRNLDRGKAAGAPVALPPNTVRLQNYTAFLSIHVANFDRLSGATQTAMRVTRRLGGYVASVDYGTGKRGQATLVLRIPISHVQQAIVRFSNLGTILAQQVSLEDVQGQVNDQTKRIVVLREQIASLERTLRTQTLTPEQRARLEIQLVNAKATLTAVIRQKTTTVKRARLARVALTLTTEKQAVAPHKSGRVGRALDDAGTILAKEAAIVLYVLVVAGPLLLLAAAAVAGGRLLRRRGEQRLLERTT